jgi:NAD-dependent dihydropyrimidine dehydrogenase PreA subunit
MAGEAKGKIDVDQNECKGCGLCIESCPVHGLELSADLNHYGVHTAELKEGLCSGCGICYYVCPEPGAIMVYRRVVERVEVRDAATV